MFGLHLGLQTNTVFEGSSPSPAPDRWLWEPGQTMMWEAGYYIQLD